MDGGFDGGRWGSSFEGRDRDGGGDDFEHVADLFDEGFAGLVGRREGWRRVGYDDWSGVMVEIVRVGSHVGLHG